MNVKAIIKFIVCVFVLGIMISCEQGNKAKESEEEENPYSWEIKENFQELAANPAIFHKAVQNLTDIIVHDIFSPPVASRVYTYPSVAAYEVMQQSHEDYISLANQAHGLKDVPQAPEGEISYPLASMQAFMSVAGELIFSGDKMEEFRNAIYADFQKAGVPYEVYDRSLEFGNQVGAHILEWSTHDLYKETRTFERYTVNPDIKGRWTPTPPDYMDGIEPHWNKIRTFIIDSATQFVPLPPTAYNPNKSSKFFKEMMEVYNIGRNLSDEQEEIAQFWDCNPFATTHVGHVMFATKKISPGGHWIGISGIAARKAKCDFMQTAETYARVSISLADAFISCWDEKYRSNLVRPETVINELVDETWTPLLQTPPFPEYTSGHSVISASASTTLTDLFGEPFPFADSTEVKYGLPVRSYESFIEASEEAAVSRLYGGIHYRPACDIGVFQGRKIGNYVVEHLRTRKADLQLSSTQK
ncbi:MAG: vanadium-dependent haloperoxidase [Bacteroidota bacterium]